MDELYDKMLRELGMKTQVLLEMHAENPAEFNAQHVFERLAGAYVDIGVRNYGWPSDEDDE
ncbi:hypothetical protein ACTL32_18400 [Planococcus sp. FY231025]|uniref:hypothetical protein n=1 Tax=Planococcus sp. FY231025 TaxID=3455699 RepID=UPI003F8F990C